MRTRAKSFIFTNETPVTNVPNTAAHQMRKRGKERKSVSPLVSEKWIWEHLGEKEVPLCLFMFKIFTAFSNVNG